MPSLMLVIERATEKYASTLRSETSRVGSVRRYVLLLSAFSNRIDSFLRKVSTSLSRSQQNSERMR